MKKDIHPTVYKAHLICACGNEIEAFSTKGEKVQVEICSNCHDFYTGKKKSLENVGRVSRFRQKYAQPDRKTAS